MRTRSSHAIARSLASFGSFTGVCRRMASVICCPTVRNGLSDDFGFWKIMAISLPRTRVIDRSSCARQPGSSLATATIRPSRSVTVT